MYINVVSGPRFEIDVRQGRTQEGRDCRAAAPPKPKLKKTHFLDIMVLKVLRDLPFSRNQPLKSADD
jgi:hypothetical protein